MGRCFTTLEDMQTAGLITEDQLTSGLLDSLPEDRKLDWKMFQALGASPPIGSSSKRWAAVVEIDSNGRVDRGWFSRPGGVASYRSSRMTCPVDLLGDVHAIEIGSDEAPSRGKREIHRTYWVSVPVSGYDNEDPIQVAWLLCPTAQYAWGLRNALRLHDQSRHETPTQPVEPQSAPDNDESLAAAEPETVQGSDVDVLGLLTSCEVAIVEEDWHAAHYLAQQLACELLGRKLAQRRLKDAAREDLRASVDRTGLE